MAVIYYAAMISHRGLIRIFPNGWGITLSNERYLNSQGKNYENIGLPVDHEFVFLLLLKVLIVL